jgi:hypothetical protein
MGAARACAGYLALGLLVAATPFLSRAGTIAPGQNRTVAGKIAAVDLVHRTLVLEVPRPGGGSNVVGVTLGPGVEPTRQGQAVPLSQVGIGDGAALRYTREAGRLIGLRLELQR